MDDNIFWRNINESELIGGSEVTKAAVSIRDIYLSLIATGFTESQAMELTTSLIQASVATKENK